MRRAARIAVSRLSEKYPVNEAEAMVRELIHWKSGKDLSELILESNENQGLEYFTSLGEAIERIRNGEPLQYITGRAWFYRRAFEVGPGVLIPRPETEELTGLALEFGKEIQGRPIRLLDIGCGSGCIAISIDLEFPGNEVFGLDISPFALEYSRRNQEKFNSKVRFMEADIFGCESRKFQQLHMIVSNPPYVPESDKAKMATNVLEHEPAQALFPPIGSELIFYRKIAGLGKSWLRPGGVLLFEIHESAGSRIRKLLEECGYREIRILKDLAGRDRFAVGISAGGDLN